MMLEGISAGVAGFCWGMASLLCIPDNFPTLPFSLSWHSLFWMPFVLWGGFFVLARLGQTSEEILLLNEQVRTPELYIWLSGMGVSVLVFVAWLMAR